MGNKYYLASYDFEQTSLPTDGESSDLPSDTTINDQIVNFVKSEDPVLSEGDAEWRFGRAMVYEDDSFLVGRLGREFDDEPKQYNESIGDFELKKGRDADVSHFVLFLDIQVVAFNRKLRIGPDQFIRAFSTGFNRYYDTAPLMDMVRLKNDITLEQVFNNSDSVTELEFDLEPTNPEPTDEMRQMDNQFKSAEVKNFLIEMFSDVGINTKAQIVQAAKGFVGKYGDVKARYNLDGRSQQYNSRSKDAVYEGEREPEELEDVENEADRIKDQAKGVMDED
jgi:hypothetical protein